MPPSSLSQATPTLIVKNEGCKDQKEARCGAFQDLTSGTKSKRNVAMASIAKGVLLIPPIKSKDTTTEGSYLRGTQPLAPTIGS